MKLMALVGTQGRADVDAVVAELLPVQPNAFERMTTRLLSLFEGMDEVAAMEMADNILFFDYMLDIQ